jgi:hypothetical protein
MHLNGIASMKVGTAAISEKNVLELSASGGILP